MYFRDLRDYFSLSLLLRLPIMLCVSYDLKKNKGKPQPNIKISSKNGNNNFHGISSYYVQVLGNCHRIVLILQLLCRVDALNT